MPKIRNLLAVSLILAATACTSHPNLTPQAGPASPTVTASPTAVASSADPRATRIDAAMSVYQQMWSAYDKAVTHPDPLDKNLARYAGEGAADLLRGDLYFFKSQGLVGSGTTILQPKMTSAAPSAAPAVVKIADCIDTSKTHAAKADGSPYTDTKGGPRKVSAVVQYRNSVWLVTDLTVGRVGTC